MQGCQISSSGFVEKRWNSVVGTSVNFTNKTYWIVMLAKICSYSNFGSLNPNLKWVFTYDSSIANFRVANFSVSGNPEIGNTVAVGENPCQIRTQRPKITKWTNFRQHNYPISHIFKIYRSANYRISAFFNKSWVTNLATLQKPWVSRENWFYFWILHKKVNQNQRF